MGVYSLEDASSCLVFKQWGAPAGRHQEQGKRKNIRKNHKETKLEREMKPDRSVEVELLAGRQLDPS